MRAERNNPDIVHEISTQITQMIQIPADFIHLKKSAKIHQISPPLGELKGACALCVFTVKNISRNGLNQQTKILNIMTNLVPLPRRWEIQQIYADFILR